MMDPNEAREELGKMAYHAMKRTLMPELGEWKDLPQEQREKFVRMAEHMYAISAVGLPEVLDVEEEPLEPDQDVDPQMQFAEEMVLMDAFHELRNVVGIRVEVVGLLSRDSDDGFVILKLSMARDQDEELPDEVRNAFSKAGMALDGEGKLCRAEFEINREEFIRETIRVFDNAVQVVHLTAKFVGIPSNRTN